MDIPLTPEDNFVGITMLLPGQGWIFIDQFVEGITQLDFIFAIFWGDRQSINRLHHRGCPQRFKGFITTTEGFADLDILQASQGNNFSGNRLLDRLLLVSIS